MTEWTVNNKLNAWYQKRYHIKLPKQYETKSRLYFSLGGFSPSSLFALAEPGVWYDPSDVANLAWRRNLLLWSEQFDNTSWAKTAATINVNAIAAPNGTMTADKIVDTAVTGAHTIAPSALAYAAGTQYTLSAYFKAAERTWAYLVLSSTPFGTTTRAWFDLSAVTTGIVQNCTPVITDVGDGWRRCSITATTTVGGSISAPATLGVSPSDGGSSYLGVLGSGLYAWGAQLELGSAPSTYQPITDLNTEVLALFPNATMYQDRSGSIAVTTPGQFVGVRLDKSRGLTLGPELAATLPTPTINDASGSVGTWDAGTRTFGNTGANFANRPRFSFDLGLVAGKTYLITGQVSGAIAQLNTVTPGVTGAIAVYNVATGVISGRARATDSNLHFIFSLNAGSTVTIDSLSVKEIAGVIANAPTDAARMTYGIEPKTGTRNILTFTEQYDNAIWSKINLLAFGSGSTANAIAAPDATITADLLTPTTSTLGSGASQSYNNTVSQAHTLSFSVKANGTDFVQLLWHNTLSTDYANFNITTGAVTAGTYTAATITDQGNGWFRCTITSTLAVANNVVSLYIIPTATSSRGAAYTGDGIKGVYVWGGQLERSATATDYQRVTTAFDVTEAGVASCHYCQYDGTDDSMSTAAIDFTSTDAVSVFAGIRKSSDAALGTVLEFGTDSTNNNGSFALRSPNTTASAAYSYVSRGTAVSLTTSPTSFAAPRYNLLTGLSDISADQSVLRVNGVQVSSNTADQGAGTYANQALFIGRRNNTGLPFSGRDFGMLVVGKAVSAGDLASTETWLAAKTPGVTL